MSDKEKVEDQTIPIAEMIHNHFLSTVGISVPFLFVSFGEENTQYISNVERQNIIKQLKDLVIHLEVEQMGEDFAKLRKH